MVDKLEYCDIIGCKVKNKGVINIIKYRGTYRVWLRKTTALAVEVLLL